MVLVCVWIEKLKELVVLFKDILRNNKLDIVDEQTIIEISTFEAKGQSFEASNGNHDDLVMNFVMFGYFAVHSSL